MNGKILVAEDDPVQRRMVSIVLSKKLQYEVIDVTNGKEAVDYIKSPNGDSIDAVLMDIKMPIMDGFEALKIIRQYNNNLPVLMLTGDDNIETAVRAIKEGANDFVVKLPNPLQLDVAIKNAIKYSNVSKELSKLKQEKEITAKFSDIIGHDTGLKETVSYASKAAKSDVPVLIMGETGSGKELLARAIHGESKRSSFPFIAINCGAIPSNLVESILFGHEKGSFTGAVIRTIGKFREAEGGTIFLDEIGELPHESQVKLLRALQQKEIEPVGGVKPVKINVRIISATNRNLAKEVADGKFREDLYFRLNVLPITIPPLRDRKEDIIPLAEYFINQITKSENISAKQLSDSAKKMLTENDWKGNVRELENLIHRILVLSDSDIIDDNILERILKFSDTPPLVDRRAIPNMHISIINAEGNFKSMNDIEAEAMHMALKHFDDNITRASAALSIAKSTFYRKMKS
ncbi:MAG: sigma-54 dependent transcriptional regulator [Rickettsiales bacterium]